MQDISEDVINKAANGDEIAFEAIYNQYSRLVYHVAYRIVGNLEDAQEVIQDVFVRVHKSLRNFRFESSFKTWIYRIAVNVSLNYVKKMKKYKNTTFELNEEFYEDGKSNAVEEGADKEYYEEAVASLLNMLNPDQKACIVLRSIEGLRYKEIAETLGVNINTVRTRLKRARLVMLALKKEVFKNAM